MRLASPSEMKEIERRTSSEFHLSDEILMENAGAHCAREIMTSFLPEIQRGRVALLCGPGHNGGDGMVVARHLHDMGIKAIEVFVLEEGESPLWKKQKMRLEAQGLVLRRELSEPLKNFSIIVDALFGIGLSRDLQSPYTEVIQEVNSCPAPVVAIDIPSGMNALTGEAMGICVRATGTLTLGLGKPGLYTAHGYSSAGRIRVLNIGFPTTLLKKEAGQYFAVNSNWVRKRLPKRAPGDNKFSHGRLAVIAGQRGMWGAAALCCQGAYRLGAGHVTLYVNDRQEALGYLGKDLGPDVLVDSLDNFEKIKKSSAVVVGPGLGRESWVANLIGQLKDAQIEKVVLDADALSGLSQEKLLPTWVLTPHSGELSRLIDVPAAEIDRDRAQFAAKAAEIFGAHILAKGFRSWLADPHGRRAVILSGNAALAKAGTGDVLAGFIGALLAQGLDSLSAVGAAAYIHGRIADSWLRAGKDISTLMASDLPELVNEEMRALNAVRDL